MKLKHRFCIIFMLISIVPIIIITAFMYVRYTSTIDEEIMGIVHNITDNSVNYTIDTMEDINKMSSIFQTDVLNAYSILDDLKKLHSEQGSDNIFDLWQVRNNMKYVCQNYLFSNDSLNGIFIFTMNGNSLGYGKGIDIAPNYVPFQDEWYQETLKKDGSLYVGKLSKKEFILKSEESISFSKVLYDVYTREPLGVLLLDFHPDILSLNSYNTMPEALLLTIEGQNSSVLYSNASQLETSPKDRSFDTIDVNQKRLAEYGLSLSASISLPKLKEQYRYTQMVLILISLGCSFVFLIISVFLSSYITKPITELSSRMRDNNDMTLSDSRNLNRKDEIGILFNEYNHMLTSLNHYVKQEYQNKLITLDSQMRSLEAQINSHFLYNTLESINSIAELEGIDSISTMSLALGNMFRYSIKTQSELVTIQDELNHVQDYISIQRIRFDNRFTFVNRIPPDMESLKLLKLILQPLVENALYHGLQYCSSGNQIWLEGSYDDACIYLKVTDNGCGITAEQLETIRQLLEEEPHFRELGQRTKQSIGLKNIHSRIELYYGKGFGLSLDSEYQKGTCITIKVPNLH